LGTFLVLPQSHARQQIVPPQREELTSLNRTLTNELSRAQQNATFGAFRFDTREPSFERIVDALFRRRALHGTAFLAAPRNPSKSRESENEHREIQSVHREKAPRVNLPAPLATLWWNAKGDCAKAH
jgi:hypothetical protein